MPATDANAATGTLPPTCSIRGLVAFGPGPHHGELWAPARCDQVADNFATLGGYPPPLVKIGHDFQQQFARSLGFLNLGVVTRCQKVGGGCFEVDIENVPTDVGGKVSAGLLRGASVELKPHYRDPKDPARELPGDVLTGISLLGCEQPCVANWPAQLRARAVPKATFADGSPVPPDYKVDRWLNQAAEVSEKIAEENGAEFSADRRTVRIKGREYAAATLCFSDFDPNPERTMTPEQEAALQAAGFTPEQAAAMKAALSGAAPPAPPAPPAPAPAPGAPATGAPAKPDFMSMCKTMSADPAASDKDKMFAAAFSSVFSENEELKKRFGAYEAAKEEDQKKGTEAQMAMFSAQVDLDLNGDPGAGFKDGRMVKPGLAYRVWPKHRPAMKDALTAQFGPAVKTFSSESDRVAAYRAEIGRYTAAIPEDGSLVTSAAHAPAPVVDAKGLPLIEPATPLLGRMLREGGHLDRAGLARDLRARVAS